jgi:hypothetical protein
VVASTPEPDSVHNDSACQITRRKDLETITSESFLIGPLEVYVSSTFRVEQAHTVQYFRPIRGTRPRPEQPPTCSSLPRLPRTVGYTIAVRRQGLTRGLSWDTASQARKRQRLSGHWNDEASCGHCARALRVIQRHESEEVASPVHRDIQYTL